MLNVVIVILYFRCLLVLPIQIVERVIWGSPGESLDNTLWVCDIYAH